MSLNTHVECYLRLKRQLGYKYVGQQRVLRNYTQFAATRGERFVCVDTVLEWASKSPSRQCSYFKLRTIRKFAIALHAEDVRHEIPPQDVFGGYRFSRPSPHLMTVAEIRQLLDAALSVQPAASINRFTWYYLFGLMAVTGLRRSEAIALRLGDLTADGLTVRETKFRKSRLVPLHPSVQDALQEYLEIRNREGTLSDHLFVLSSGRPPALDTVSTKFCRLARQTGLRDGPGTNGPRLHDLRHSFAVRSLENLGEEDASRHMLALSTSLGHANVFDTYWYLEATPAILRKIAAKAQLSFTHSGGSHD